MIFHNFFCHKVLEMHFCRQFGYLIKEEIDLIEFRLEDFGSEINE